MCGVLFDLLYRLLCTGTRGQNLTFSTMIHIDKHLKAKHTIQYL